MTLTIFLSAFILYPSGCTCLSSLVPARYFNPRSILVNRVSAFMANTGRVASRMSLSMMEARDMVGITKPLGFFDPLGFSKGADEATLTKYRESELKHGRTAMLAVLGWLTQERFHPFYNGKLSSNPLKAFVECPPAGFVQIIVFIGLLEYVFQSVAMAQKDTYKAGDYYGFSELFPDGNDDPRWVDFQNRELNNGRLAMFGIMGEITHSFISGQGALEMQNAMLPGSVPGF